MRRAALVTEGKQSIDLGNAGALTETGSLVDRAFLRG
jgi:hypothetical protein